jgi:putative ABC transport system substrate-binding protein
MKPMRRRDFITLIGGAAAAWPCTARAQQPATPLVVFLSGGQPKASAEATRAFEQGLAQVGYNFRYGQGHNVKLEFQWAWGHNDKLPELAARLAQGHNDKLPGIAAALAQRQGAVIGHNDKLPEPAAGPAQRSVAVIATAGVPEALAAKGATTTIPIVFTIEGDPIAAGLVPTLDRPGGNVTGVAISKMQVGPKRLELLHQVIPTASTVALLVNPTNPAAEPQVRDAQAAARSLGLQLHVLKASVDNEIDAAFAALPGLQAGGLVIGSDQFFDSWSLKIAALALLHSVPAIYQHRAFTAGGGLISYGASLADPFQRAGVYTGRILKGEKPADLPVQQSTKVDLFINLKTAKALGMTIPPELRDRADEMIE